MDERIFDYSKCMTLEDIDAVWCRDCTDNADMDALQRAYELGQQSRTLPVVTIDDHRTKPRGDVARDVYLDNNWRPVPDAPEYLRNDAGQLKPVKESVE